MSKHIDLVTLGFRIRKLRKDRGFSQEYFANLIDMNRGYYGTIERGETNLTALNLLRIAKGLGVTLNDLFPPDMQEEKSKNSTEVI